MRSLTFITLFLLANVSVFAQRPDFKKLKIDIASAETSEARARTMADYAVAIPSNQHQEVLELSDSISRMGNQESNPDFFLALGEFTKGIGYYRSQDFKQSKSYLKESARLFRKLKDPFEFKALNFLAIIYTRSSQRDSAIYVYNEILERADPLDKSARIKAHGNISNVYRHTGDYYKAISHMDKVYQLDSTNAFGVLQLSMNASRIYTQLEMPDEALKVMRKVTIDTFPKIPPKGVFYHNLGNIYKDKNQLDSALIYYKKAFANSSAINYTPLQATDVSNIIETLIAIDSLDTLEELFRDMDGFLPKTKEPLAPLRYHLLLGRYQAKKGQPDLAESNFKKALGYSNNPRLSHIKPQIYGELIDLYNTKNDSNTAKLYIDSLNISQNNPATLRKEQFEAEAKAKYLLAIKERDIMEKEKQVTSFNVQRWALFAVAFILLLGVFFYFRNYRKSASGLEKQKDANEALSKKIERQHTTIVELKSKAILEAEEIIFIKSDGHYLEFALKSKKNPELDRNRLKDVLGKLPNYFVQIHRSYIINLKEVKIKYANKVVMKDGEELPVSRTYKSQLDEAISKFKD